MSVNSGTQNQVTPVTEEAVNEREAILDRHVEYYLRKHPDFFKKHKIAKIRPTVYNLDGRVISVDWQYGDAGREGQLIAVDGPLRQPFGDYITGSETNAQFDDRRLGRSSLHQIPKGRQLSFRDDTNAYSRLEAMKIAKEQALVREQAAEFVKDGAMVPEASLMAKYQKNIDIKLGNRWRRQTSPPPVSYTAPVASPRFSPPAPHQTPVPHQTQGSPVYCANHNATEKRRKISPQSVVCTSCGNLVDTNYAEFKICPACSQSQNRCVCCGAQVNGIAGKAELPPPSYCPNHDHTEKRTKTQPRNVECKLCRSVIQTNYVEFAICAVCSNSRQLCMCCGSPSSSSRTPQPSGVYDRFRVAPLAEGATDFFNLPLRPLLPTQSRMPSPSPVPSTQPTAPNAYASQPVLPTWNPMYARKPLFG